MYIYSVCVYKTYPHSPSFFLYLLLSFFLSFILFLSFWGCLGVCSFHIYMFRFCCQKKKRRKKEKKGEKRRKKEKLEKSKAKKTMMMMMVIGIGIGRISLFKTGVGVG